MSTIAPFDVDPVAPVTSQDARIRDGLPKNNIIAQRRDDRRPMLRFKPAKRWDVQVIVVVLAEQNCVDTRERFEPNPGRGYSPRPCKCEWAAAGPEWSDQSKVAQG